MSDKKKSETALGIIAALDAAATITLRLLEILEKKRELGEMTEAEELAYDEYRRKMFANPSWQVSSVASEARGE